MGIEGDGEKPKVDTQEEAQTTGEGVIKDALREMMLSENVPPDVMTALKSVYTEKIGDPSGLSDHQVMEQLFPDADSDAKVGEFADVLTSIAQLRLVSSRTSEEIRAAADAELEAEWKRTEQRLIEEGLLEPDPDSKKE